MIYIQSHHATINIWFILSGHQQCVLVGLFIVLGNDNYSFHPPFIVKKTRNQVTHGVAWNEITYLGPLTMVDGSSFSQLHSWEMSCGRTCCGKALTRCRYGPRGKLLCHSHNQRTVTFTRDDEWLIDWVSYY